MVAALVERKPGPGPGGDDGEEGGPMVGRGGLVGKAAPAFVLTNAEGKAVDLKDLEGQVVILDFWATWCGPCVAALPALHQTASWAREQNLPVTVLAVNTMEHGDSPDAKVARVKQFWTSKKFTLPVLMDFSSQTAAEYGVRGIPATFIIRSDGVVHANHVGFPGSADALINMLKKDIRGAIDALEQKVAPAPGGERTPEGAAAR
jgi:peroxiredoxin